MSLFGNISMLNAAMLNYQNGIDVIANNAANAGVVGYTRERLVINSLNPMQDGPLQFGQGATSTSVERLRNIFLDNQIKLQLADVGKADARSIALQDLSSIFPEILIPGSTAGIQGALDTLATKWSALALAPGSAAAQTGVRDAADALAQLLNQDSRQINDFQTNLDTEVTTTISQINILTDQIASLNQQIILAKAAGQGHDPNPLLDAREQAAEKLSKLIGGNYFVNSLGSMNVTSSGGILVDGSRVFHLKAIPSATDPGRTGVGYFDNLKNIFVNITSKINSGKLAGLIQARDIDAEDARLTLDKIAFGMISKTNEINRTAIAADLTTNHAVFTGTKAADIAIDPTLRTNVSYFGDTSYYPTLGPPPDPGAPGAVAKAQASMQSILMYSGIQSAPATPINNFGFSINPTTQIQALRLAGAFKTNPGAAPAGAPGQFVISSGLNAVTITWTDTDTVNTIVRQINAAGGGAIQATYDQTAQKMFIYTDAPTTVYDVTGSFAKAMALSAVVTSSAPINNSPISGLNKAVSAQALNSATNLLSLFTDAYPQPVPAANYTTKFDNTNVTWQPINTIGTILITGIQTTTPAGDRIYANFNSAQQVVTLVKSGDQGFNAGILSVANPLVSIAISDQTGNLTRVFNFDTNENSTRLMSEFATTMAARTSSEDVLKTQAQNLVDETQHLQDQSSDVNTNLAGELAQARIYQRSYEASVRLQSIMDEMLNVLINHTGSLAGGGNGLSS